MELKVNEREALLIVTALGWFQNRVGQKASWCYRKRLPTLRARKADCVIIGDDEECKEVSKEITNAQRYIERRIALGEEVSRLRERLKVDAGITDERVNTYNYDDRAGE